MTFPSFLEVLFGSLAVIVNDYINFRPMTLRHQVSLVLPFGQPVDLCPQKDFRCSAFAPPPFETA